MTSRQAVDRVLRLIPSAKAGHAGTLDPLATGVLIVCVGRATRLIEYVQRKPKNYVGAFLLGRRSDTEDIEGEIETLADPPIPSLHDIEAVLPRFVGEILQRPPVFSALKVAGKRAYKLARRGKQVELKPRPIAVYKIEIERYAYPEIVFNIHCGSGTYVRSLGRDIAEALGTAAVMSALERTAIGDFHLADAVDPNQLTAENMEKHLLPLARAIDDLPSLPLNEVESEKVLHGCTVILSQPLPDKEIAAKEIAVYDAAGDFLALVQPLDASTIKPIMVFQ